jgi:hypothetical protein
MSGGAHTSRTMMLRDLAVLLDSFGCEGSLGSYREAVIEANVLGKGSLEGRRRSFRYLRELYGLDADDPGFHGLRSCWGVDERARPLMALARALSRDRTFAATAPVVLAAPAGELVTGAALSAEIQRRFPGTYNQASAARIGRNAASSWTQSGHLAGRVTKRRVKVEPRPASVAYVLFLGYLQGERGEQLLRTLPARALDASRGN